MHCSNNSGYHGSCLRGRIVNKLKNKHRLTANIRGENKYILSNLIIESSYIKALRTTLPVESLF